MTTDAPDDTADGDLPPHVDRHLGEIERHVRAARGDPVDVSPWDFGLPTGSDLRALRETCGLSKAAVAEATGYEANTVRAWENGDAAPSREAIRRVLALYKREWPRSGGGPA